jgi:hypothetical protein
MRIWYFGPFRVVLHPEVFSFTVTLRRRAFFMLRHHGRPWKFAVRLPGQDWKFLNGEP